MDDEAALRSLIDDASDERAATTVMERVIPRLAGFLRGRYPSLAPEDAHDVARDALVIALERRALFDPGRDARAGTWLHGIAKVRALDFLRKRGHQVPLEDGLDRPAATPQGPEDGGPLGKRIRDAIDDLPPQQRRAAQAHYLDGRQPRDVDEQYGWRPNTANVYLTHARRALRRRLAQSAVDHTTPPSATYQPSNCRSRLRLRIRRRLLVGAVT